MYIHCDITTIYGADENADEADEENYFFYDDGEVLSTI